MCESEKDSHDFRKTSEAPAVSLPLFLSPCLSAGSSIDHHSPHSDTSPPAISLFQHLSSRCKASPIWVKHPDRYYFILSSLQSLERGRSERKRNSAHNIHFLLFLGTGLNHISQALPPIPTKVRLGPTELISFRQMENGMCASGSGLHK